MISFRVYGFGLIALGIQLWAFHSKTIGLGVTSHLPGKPCIQILATIYISSEIQVITYPKLADSWLNWALTMVYKKIWFKVNLFGV